MKNNLYFSTVLRRKNVIKGGLFDLLFDLCSYPKLLLEVFIKQDFGERYFSYSTAMVMARILFFLPIVICLLTKNLINSYGNYSGLEYLIYAFASWYAFLGAFIYLCIKRRNEIRRNPSVFDFEKFSLYSGTPTKRFEKILKLLGSPNPRKQELNTEPILFFFVSLVLMILGQSIGYLICIASFFYWLRNKVAYSRGGSFHNGQDRRDDFERTNG